MLFSVEGMCERMIETYTNFHHESIQIRLKSNKLIISK